MNIADNILKAQLQNVFFVCGTACGGKTTATRALAQKYALTLYDMDAHFDRHKALANPVDQPAMTREFQSLEAFFLRPVPEYASWLRQSLEEQLPMVLLDLAALSRQGRVVADLHMPPCVAARVADANRIAYLIADPRLIARDYANRPDHEGFRRAISSLSDPKGAMDNCSRALDAQNRPLYEAVKKSDLFWLERGDSSTPERTLALLEHHFGLKPQ